jgi:hypothetical protein
MRESVPRYTGIHPTVRVHRCPGTRASIQVLGGIRGHVRVHPNRDMRPSKLRYACVRPPTRVMPNQVTDAPVPWYERAQERIGVHPRRIMDAPVPCLGSADTPSWMARTVSWIHPRAILDAPMPCLGSVQGPSWMHPCPVLDPPKACPGSTPTVCRIHQSRCWNRLSPGMRTSRVRRGCTHTVVWMRRRTGCPPVPVGGSPRSRSCIGPRHGTRGPVALHRRACGEGWIDPCLERGTWCGPTSSTGLPSTPPTGR